MPITTLPETANVGDRYNQLEIKNHKVVNDDGLFDWMSKIVWNDNPEKMFSEMQNQGIDWWSAAEYMATELEDDEIFHEVLKHMAGELWGVFADLFYKTKTSAEIKKSIIYAIRHCDSYEEFIEKFSDDFCSAIKTRVESVTHL